MARSLSVVVPALNEREHLESSVNVLVRALAAADVDFDIIIVDDGSSDETGEIADRLAAANPRIRVIHHAQNMGLGSAYRHGVEVAQKEYFFWVPGDNVCPEETLVTLFRKIGEVEVVIPRITNVRGRALGRRIVSRSYNQMMNFLFGYRIHSIESVTIFPTAFLRANPPSTSGYGFQAEALFRALDRKLSFVEVPVAFYNPVGRSKAVTLKNIISVIATVIGLYAELRIRPLLRRVGTRNGSVPK
jgi:glycosyltransferase involved in cell wall biosynthesis